MATIAVLIFHHRNDSQFPIFYAPARGVYWQQHKSPMAITPEEADEKVRSGEWTQDESRHVTVSSVDSRQLAASRPSVPRIFHTFKEPVCTVESFSGME